jgi:hypothetical protein
MTLCEYHILGYSNSALQIKGTPIVIVLYLSKSSANPLRGFVLKSWEDDLTTLYRCDLSSVKDFLEDLCYYTQQNSELSWFFFKRLANLSAGHLRQFASGACAFDDLEGIVSTIFGSHKCRGNWREQFDAIEPP